jgi:hypothetical protein
VEVNERLDQLQAAVTNLCENEKLIVENTKILHRAITGNVADSMLKMDADVTRLGELYEKMVVIVNNHGELLKVCVGALERCGLLGGEKPEKPN